ncbi:MAG: hypothetical protein LIO72_00920, partial [Ruminococcus sp.]|nr:hypothetical protein [Ruminococcus sp.]
MGSATVVVGSSSTPSSSTTNGITVTAVNNASTVISWTANINCASYAVTYTTASGTYNAGITTSTSCTLAIAYSSLKSVTVTGYSSESGTGTATTVGTWTQSSSSSGSTSSGVTATNLGYNASYEAYAYSFSWTAVSNASQYGLNVTSSSGNSNTYTTANTSYSAYLLPGNTYYVTVYAYTGSGNITVGAVAFTVGGSSSTSSGITYTENGYWPYGYFSYTFEWNAFSSDTYIYDIYYNNEYVASTTETSYTDIYIDSGSYVVTVYAKDEEGELLGNVGSVSFMTTPLAITAITVTMPYIIMSNSYMKVFFSWDDIEYASYYEVSYTSSTGEEGTLVVEDCSYQAVLKRGCTYSITIKAYNDRDKMLTEGGLPNWTINSSSSSTTTEAVMCELAGITSDGDDRYAVSYNSYDGATHYQVTAYEVSGTSYVLTDTSDYTTELETTLDLEDGKTYRIYVYAYDPSYYRLGLVGYTDITTDASVAENAEFTFTLPFYGTLSAGDEMIVTLPSSLTTDESVVLPIEYSITLNGVTVKLEGSDGTESGVYEQIVEIGMFARDYFSSEEITVDAMLPELTEVSTTSDIVITASVDCSEYDGAPIISAEDLSSTYGSLMTVAANHIWHEGQFADISSSYVALYPITSSFTGGTITTDLVSATSGLTVTVEASAESGYELSGVMVTDADEASVAVTDCGDGIYTFTMPSSAVTVSADVSHAHSLAKTDAVTETCLTEGNIEYWHCSVCGKYYSDEYATDEITLEDTITPKIAHSYEAVVTNPTCTESGYTTYTCSVCGDSYVADETEATGHSYEAV